MSLLKLSLFILLSLINFFTIQSQELDIYLLTDQEKEAIGKDQTGQIEEKMKEALLIGKASSKMISWKDNGRNNLFRPDAKKAYDDMLKAYDEDRKNKDEYKKAPPIKPVSAFRSYGDQLGIWNAKFIGERKMESYSKEDIEAMSSEERIKIILKYSSAPGTSRHHWGTDIDLNSLKNEYFETGEGKLLYKWLKENAHKFGFCQPYTSFEEKNIEGFFQGRDEKVKTYFPNSTEEVKGYYKENWHWSFAPVSQKLVEDWVDLYVKKGKDPKSILGKIGGIEAVSPEMPLGYVTAVNKGCYRVREYYLQKKNSQEKDILQNESEPPLSLWGKIIIWVKNIFGL